MSRSYLLQQIWRSNSICTLFSHLFVDRYDMLGYKNRFDPITDMDYRGFTDIPLISSISFRTEFIMQTVVFCLGKAFSIVDICVYHILRV